MFNFLLPSLKVIDFTPSSNTFFFAFFGTERKKFKFFDSVVYFDVWLDISFFSLYSFSLNSSLLFNFFYIIVSNSKSY